MSSSNRVFTMTEVAIRDFERGLNVGLVSDEEGLKTDDQLLIEETQMLTDMGESDFAVDLHIPGHQSGEYQRIVIEPGEQGYALALVDRLPSPFDIADLSLRDELPPYRAEPVGEPSEGEEDVSPGLADEIAQSASEWLSGEDSPIAKYRVYVDSEDEVPDEYEVQYGEQGGIFYEREPGGRGDDGTDDEPGMVHGVIVNQYEFIQQAANGTGVWFTAAPRGQVESFRGFIVDGMVAVTGQPETRFPPKQIIDMDREHGAGLDYDVDTEFGERVGIAVEFDDTDIIDIPAQDWMRFAGEIEDDDLLTEALVDIEADGSVTARDRIRRRLRGLGWTDEEIDDTISEMRDEMRFWYTEEDHETWQDTYTAENVVEEKSLREEGIVGGVNAADMEIHTLEDGTRAFVQEPTGKNLDDIFSFYEFTRKTGFEKYVPPTKMLDDGQKFAIQEYNDGGTDAIADAPNSWKRKVDIDELVEMYSYGLVAGHTDLHHRNVFVSEGGDLAIIDLDHSTNQIFETAGKSRYSPILYSAVQIMSAWDYDDLPDWVDVDRDEYENMHRKRRETMILKEPVFEYIADRAEELAHELVESAEGDIDQYLPDLNDYQESVLWMREEDIEMRRTALRDNITLLAENYRERTEQ